MNNDFHQKTALFDLLEGLEVKEYSDISAEPQTNGAVKEQQTNGSAPATAVAAN